MRHHILTVALGLAAAMLLGHTVPAPAQPLPPISNTTAKPYPGSFVWFDLVTPDSSDVRDYYRSVFGWEIEPAAGYPGYDIVSNKGRPIAGIAEVPGEQPLWLGSVSVHDLDRAVAAAQRVGGSVIEPARDVGPRGEMAIVSDGGGALFALLHTRNRDPRFPPVRAGDWLWVDLFTDDVTAAEKFYSGLFRARLETVEDRNGDEVMVFARGTLTHTGVVENPFKNVEPIWLPYVRVDDLEAVKDASAANGGGVYFEHKDIAILLDPAGAAIGVQELPRKEVVGQ